MAGMKKPNDHAEPTKVECLTKKQKLYKYCTYYLCFFSYDMTLANHCSELANRWLASTDDQLSQFTAADIKPFLPSQTIHFLALFLSEVSISF